MCIILEVWQYSSCCWPSTKMASGVPLPLENFLWKISFTSPGASELMVISSCMEWNRMITHNMDAGYQVEVKSLILDSLSWFVRGIQFAGECVLSHSSSNPGRSTGQAWTPATIENGPNDDTWVLIKPSDADTGNLLVILGQYHSS